uniref:ABC transporter related n=1 Tax=Solibacter usitatus (strain Ellin6076) TaxID=234267 RepID=Q022W7_SOLUE
MFVSSSIAAPAFSIRELIAPFRKPYLRYLAGSVLRQILLVVGGYSVVWTLRFCLRRPEISVWWVVPALIAFDGLYVGLDTALNALFARHISFPLFGNLRATALEKMFHMPLEWHQRETSGALVAKVNNGVGRVVQTAEAVSRELCPALIRTGLNLVPLLYFSLVTAPVLLGSVLIFGWLTVIENSKRRSFRRERHQHYVRDSGVFSEYVQSVQTIVQFGQTHRLLDSYGQLQRQIMDGGLAEMQIAYTYGVRKNMVLSAGKRTCQALWIWQMQRGHLDVATLMYLNMLTEELLSSFWNYAGLLERIYEDLEPARILIEMLEAHPAINDPAGALPVEVPGAVGIDLINVRFSYARGRQVVRNVSLSIEQGTIVGVVGRSGSGKSTLHHLVSRLFDIEHGELLVAGTDVRQWPLEQLRGVFASVTQSGGVFLSGVTILDTIRFGRPQASAAEAESVARCACIHDDIERMSDGYLTPVLQGGANLSKGQQQRIALAQTLLALTGDRKVLVLDEFTSQLDSETEARILRNLRPWLAGRTALIIAHRLSTVREFADRIVVLQDGAVADEGKHQELVDRNPWYAEVARFQANSTTPVA